MHKNFLATLLFVFSLLFIFSCKEDQPTEPGNDPKTVYQVIEDDQGTIGAAGGKITVPSGNGDLSGAFIEIPEGALSQNKEIKISLAASSERNPESASPIYVKFSPSNTSFSKPVKIGLPIKEISSSSNVSAFYYDGSNQVNELFVYSVSSSRKVVTAETDHFSVYYAVDKKLIGGAFMGIDRLKIDGKPGVKINDIGGVGGSGLHHVYSRDNQSNALMSLTQGTAKYAHIRFRLFKDDIQIGDDQTFIIEKVADDGTDWQIRVMNYYDNATLYSRYISELDSEINNWFSGLPLVCKFDNQIENNTEYYVKIQWFLSPSSNRDSWMNANTMIYEFGTIQSAERVSQMTSYSNDANNNFIDDDYEGTSINYPPSIPSQELPENNSIDVPLDTKLDWYCSDTENDPLTYDIYLSQNNPPSLFESNYTSANAFDPGGLEAGKTYYWYIVAKDDQQNSTKGPVWKFTTKAPSNEFAIYEPNSNTTWMKNVLHEIKWTTGSDIPEIKIDLYKGDDRVKVISYFDPNNGSANYRVPDDLEADNDYRVKITSFSDASVYSFSDYFTIVDYDRFIEITYPDTHTKIYPGETLPIRWNHDNMGGNVQIELFDKNNYELLISFETENDGSYENFKPLGGLSTEYQIKIKLWGSFSEVYDFSDYFLIGYPDSLYSPTEGSTWTLGDNVEITWRDYGLDGNVKLELHWGSSNVATITESTPNDGKFEWTVPTNLTAAPTYGVKLTPLKFPNGWSFGGPFEIIGDGIIAVTEPTASTEWQQGQDNVTISWETGDIGGNVSIELYKGSSLVETIISSTSNDGNYNTWDVPDNIAVGTNYRVKVSSTTQTDSYDYSEYFEIKAKPIPPLEPTLIAPENNATGQAVNPTLSWNTSSGATSYTLQVSTSNSFSSFVYNQSGLSSTSKQISGLQNNTKYYWRVSATNSYGTSNWSAVWNYETVINCPSIVSHGGRNYPTVIIGNQCWLKENLNYETANSWCYDNNTANCNTYGRLYTWSAAMNGSTTEGAQGICPDGWHIPTLAEFQELETYVGNQAAKLVREDQPATAFTPTNETGFSALFAGYRNGDGNFGNLGINTTFWSSTGSSSNRARYMFLSINRSDVYLYNDRKERGFSVRCVQD